MKRLRGRIDACGDASILTKLKYFKEAQDNHYKIDEIDYINCSMFECEKCGFIAFWRGDPGL